VNVVTGLAGAEFQAQHPVPEVGKSDNFFRGPEAMSFAEAHRHMRPKNA
jgi:hypothetical protein